MWLATLKSLYVPPEISANFIFLPLRVSLATQFALKLSWERRGAFCHLNSNFCRCFLLSVFFVYAPFLPRLAFRGKSRRLRKRSHRKTFRVIGMELMSFAVNVHITAQLRVSELDIGRKFLRALYGANRPYALVAVKDNFINY